MGYVVAVKVNSVAKNNMDYVSEVEDAVERDK